MIDPEFLVFALLHHQCRSSDNEPWRQSRFHGSATSGHVHMRHRSHTCFNTMYVPDLGDPSRTIYRASRNSVSARWTVLIDISMDSDSCRWLRDPSVCKALRTVNAFSESPLSSAGSIVIVLPPLLPPSPPLLPPDGLHGSSSRYIERASSL